LLIDLCEESWNPFLMRPVAELETVGDAATQARSCRGGLGKAQEFTTQHTQGPVMITV